MKPSRWTALALAGALVAGGVVYALRPPPAREVANANAPPLAEQITTRPDGSVHHALELVAREVDIAHLGVHTHANWVVFELPFDVTDEAVKRVSFAARTTTDADVGALHTRLGCLRVPPTPMGEWAYFTKNGVGFTHTFDEHGLVPTQSPRALAINLPTRLANAAACWRPALAKPETWRLRVEWDATLTSP